LIVFDDAIAEKEQIKRLNGQLQDREMESARLKLAKLKEVKPKDLVVTSVGDQLLTGSFVSNDPLEPRTGASHRTLTMSLLMRVLYRNQYFQEGRGNTSWTASHVTR